jgi:hypothetical protein
MYSVYVGKPEFNQDLHAASSRDPTLKAFSENDVQSSVAKLSLIMLILL